jgi:hypothetical protein
MNHLRFFDVLCHGLTLCIDEIKAELANGLVAEPERPSFAKCLAELNDTLAKLQDAQAGRSVATDQTFWFNLDDALYVSKRHRISSERPRLNVCARRSLTGKSADWLPKAAMRL